MVAPITNAPLMKKPDYCVRLRPLYPEVEIPDWSQCT